MPRPSSPPGAKASTECPFVVQYLSPKRPHISSQNSNEILQLTHHAQEPSIGICPGGAFNASALRAGAHVLTYAPLRCSPSHADYTTMPNSFQNHIHIIVTASKPAARNSKFLQQSRQKFWIIYPVPARNSCNIHGHHNRNHCIIIHLNTRIFCNYSSQLSPLPRSDNPLQKTRAKCQRRFKHPHHSARVSRRTKTYSP